MDRKHVVVGLLSTGSCKTDMTVSLAQLAMVSIFNCDLSIANASHSSPANGRNRMALAFVRSTADYLLMIDSDMEFPADALNRLLDRSCDIVGATYARRAPPHETMGKWDGEASGLVPAYEVPTGFILIHRRVFERIPPPWFFEPIEWDKGTPDNPTGTTSEDVAFCRLAREYGYIPFIDFDLSYEMGHIGDSTARCSLATKK